MATSIEKSLQDALARSKSLEEKLKQSPTAYARSTPLTTKDISTSGELEAARNQIEQIKSQQIRNKWYGAGTEEDTGKEDMGLIMKGISALQKPMSAIVGAGQYALGKGTESSLVGNINAAMKNNLMSGDVLEQFGMPRWAQIPLGFALDVALDPVNWATAGTAALLPRVGVGLIKGGTKKAAIKSTIKGAESLTREAAEGLGVRGALGAAKKGLTSSLEKKAATTMKFVPFAKQSKTYRDLAEKVAARAVKGADEYNMMIGKDILNAGRTPFFIKPGTIGQLVKKGVEALPKGKEIYRAFEYSAKNADILADKKDEIIGLLGRRGATFAPKMGGKRGAHFETLAEFNDPNAVAKIRNKAGKEIEVTIREADGALKKLDPKQFPDSSIRVLDNIENAEELLIAAGRDIDTQLLTDVYHKTPAGKTGVKFYDDFVDKLKSITVDDALRKVAPKLAEGLDVAKAEGDDIKKAWNSYANIKNIKPLDKILKGQEFLLAGFKSAKVAMSASAQVVAFLGNYIMGAMEGLPVWKKGYTSSVLNANRFLKGRLPLDSFLEMFQKDFEVMADIAIEHPSRFRRIYQMDPEAIFGKIKEGKKIQTELKTGVKLTDAVELKKEMVTILEGIKKAGADWEKIKPFETQLKGIGQGVTKSPATKKEFRDILKMESQSSVRARKIKEGDTSVYKSEGTGSVSEGEFTANEYFDALKEKFEQNYKNNPTLINRALNGMINVMPRQYEHIDQSFKIGTVNYLIHNGLTEGELNIVRRFNPITNNDIAESVIEGGERLYKLNPLKASEIATETFMNYAAMPDFVKVMRALPIAGSPFFSFPYAIVTKTGKTLINNPAIFNKVSFLTNEMNAGRTPEEKRALESKYNQYLNSPSVVKMFGMWNVNVKNMVPYYTLNMLSPSERRYSDNSAQSQFLKQTDKIPLFQHPVGQIMKDYFLQPWLLSGSNQISQGQFGQPLYPSFDSEGKPRKVGFGERSLYATRTGLEAFMPGTLSYAGLANALVGLSPDSLKYIPSYGIQSVAEATQGKSSIGAQTKEGIMWKTLRTVMSRTGVPSYTLDPTKTTTPK